MRKIFNLSDNREEVIAQALPMEAPPRWFLKIFNVFPAFADANYRTYFYGQFTSLVGTWIQIVAQGWLVLQLTNSAFWVGVVSALGTLPILLFGLFGGVVVDRFSTKHILYLTNILPMLFASLLGALTLLDSITLWHVCVLAFLLGTVNALDMPARHSFVAEMMDKKHLSSAIALNAATFNGSRVIGPSIAGILIAFIGTGAAFIVNAISFLGPIVSLRSIPLKTQASEHTPHPFQAIKEGIRYAFSWQSLRIFMILASTVSIFGWSYVAILPVVTKEVFQREAAGLGYLHTATGIGALLAAILVSAFSHRISARRIVIPANILLGTALLSFSLTSNFAVALFFMFVTGFSLIIQFSLINGTIQHMIDSKMRGRVMGIYVAMFRGTAPIGAFLMGFLAEHFSSPVAIRVGAIAIFITAAVLFMKRKQIPDNGNGA